MKTKRALNILSVSLNKKTSSFYKLGAVSILNVSMCTVAFGALTINEGGVEKYFDRDSLSHEFYSKENSYGKQNSYNQYPQNTYIPDSKNNYNQYKPSDATHIHQQLNNYNFGNQQNILSNSPTSSFYDINDFQRARQAARQNRTSSLYDYEQKMRGTLFAMYPEYWRLDSQINTLSPSTVVNFVNKYPNTVMAEKLAADYAEAKARSGDYLAIQKVSPYIKNADESEACAMAIGDVYTRNSMRIAEQKSKVWLNTLKKQPNLCKRLASVLNNSAMINDKDRQMRLFRMLRVGKNADVISLSSSLQTPINYSQLQDIKDNPNNFLTRFSVSPFSQTNQYLYLYAIARITDKSYREAVSQLEYDIRQDNQRSVNLISEQTRRMAYRTIAVARMNMNTDHGFSHEAVDWFRKSLGEPFNFEEAEDYAMAGIRFNEWQDVVNAITNMDGAHQKEDTWSYWLARAYEQQGNSAYHSLYSQVAKRNNYYGFLAKDKVGQAIDLSSMGGYNLPQITSSQKSKLLNDKSFARAFALYGVNENYAKREWNWGVNRALENREYDLLIAAAKRAHDMGWYDRSIYAMEKANESVGTLSAAISYPTPRRNSVIRYSMQAGIDPAWAYGILRQESRFHVGARSNVGAGGLMQIMPGTGKYIARKLGERYSASKIAHGDTNIRYGTWYMSDAFNKLGSQTVVATAGYNAGPSKAKRWQPDFGSLVADQYVETIAYPETRNYVKRVMENSTVYGSLLNRPKPLTQRMGTVYPKY